MDGVLSTAYARIGKLGGARRDRTADPLLAKQVLSQLSYGPSSGVLIGAARQYRRTAIRGVRKTRDVVGLGGFEPPTSPLSGVRSNQLSYRPELISKQVRQFVWALAPSARGTSWKGGDPAAGSPTATLLRLHPSH